MLRVLTLNIWNDDGPHERRYQLVGLPDSGDEEKRSAVSVTIDAPFGELSFTCTHLNWKLHHGFVGERQVVALAELVLVRSLPPASPR